MRAQIASWIAMSSLSFGAVAESARAGQLMDSILNRKAQQSGALPPTYPTSNYASVVANYGSYAPAQTPVPASAAIPFGVPQTVGSYLPTASYDTQWNPAQVTYYRPVTSFNPQTGTTVTTMQPCTSLQYQAQRVPLAAPAAVLGNNGLQSNLWPGITGPGYYPAGLSNAPAYPGFQQLPANGGALGTSGVSMGMPPSSLPVTTFNSNSALRPTVLAQPRLPQPGLTQSYLPAASYVQPSLAVPTYSPPAYAPPTYSVPANSAPVYSAPAISSPSYGAPVVGSGALSTMGTTVTPLSSSTIALPAPSVSPAPSGVVPASGYSSSGSTPVGSGVVGSSYFAPTQSLPMAPSNGYAQPYSNVAPAASFQSPLQQAPLQQSPCANGACPLPSASPSANSNPYLNPNSYGQVLPQQGGQVLPPTAGNNVPPPSFPGATVTPLGEPRYETVPPTQPLPMAPQNLPPVNNLPLNNNTVPQGGPGGVSDPDAQRAPSLKPSSASNYRPATDNFVGVDADRADFTVPAGAVNPSKSAVQNAITFSPATPSSDSSSPTLDLVLGGHDRVQPDFNTNAKAPALLEKAPSNVVTGEFAKPVPVPSLLRPSTVDSKGTSNSNSGSVPAGSKVAVPLNSPEGFNPRELGLPNLNDPNDPVASNRSSLERSPTVQNQTNSPNIRFISGSSVSAKLKTGELVEKKVRWTEPVVQSISQIDQSGIHNGVWFEPRK